jgi:hypothetical protein
LTSIAGYTIGIALGIFGCAGATGARDAIRDDLRKFLGSSTLLSKVFNNLFLFLLSNTIFTTSKPSLSIFRLILFCLLTFTITFCSSETVVLGTINNDDLL